MINKFMSGSRLGPPGGTQINSRLNNLDQDQRIVNVWESNLEYEV